MTREDIPAAITIADRRHQIDGEEAVLTPRAAEWSGIAAFMVNRGLTG
jgi:hypothetical protein